VSIRNSAGSAGYASSRSLHVALLVPLLLLALANCRTDRTPSSVETTRHAAYVPDEELGELFRAVQSSGIFPDSKTFNDCIPLSDPAAIVAAFHSESAKRGFDLREFVHTNFRIPNDGKLLVFDPQGVELREHLNRHWDFLKRSPDSEIARSSLLPLPEPYVVPGGRFREIYYWDTYFTMEGLAASDRLDLIENMLDNFSFLIEEYGHIPNGNRSYYLSRSQPPLFAEMIALWARLEGWRAAAVYLPALEAEYRFWMDRRDAGEIAFRRTVKLDGGVLNRYWDEKISPRPEAYVEDVEIANPLPAASRGKLYRNIRATAESGWDFSSRWCEDPQDLATLRTTDLIPVDLNSLMVNMEMTLSRLYAERGNSSLSERLLEAANRRKDLLIRYCWNEQAGFFFDYDFRQGVQTPHWTLAGVYPLTFGIATADQAQKVADSIRRRFLVPGGVLSTLENTNQQWDAPNGWAPLHWIVIRGLRNFGEDDLAEEIAARWLGLNEQTFRRTGKMMEKYDVQDLSAEAGGGEYPTQDGFGWTNGVFLALFELGYQPAAVGKAADAAAVN
jgi:alpha,alpha-trehalase